MTRRSIRRSTVAWGSALALLATTVLATTAQAAPPAGDGPPQASLRAQLESLPSAKAAPGARKGAQQRDRQKAQGKQVEPQVILPRTDFSDGAVRRTATLTDIEVAAANPAQSIRRAVVTQNLQTRRITAQVTLGAVPGANSSIVVALGEWSGNSCLARALVGGSANGGDAGGAIGNQTINATHSRSGAVVTFTSAAHASIRTAEWECAWAFNTATPQSQVKLSGLYAESLVTVWTPKLVIDRGVPVQGSRRGTWTTVRVDLNNTGRGTATGVRLRATGKGLQIKPKVRKVGRLGDRSTTYGLTYKVRVKGKKAKQRPLTLTATAAGGHRGKARVTIAIQPKPRKLPSVAGRYYWGHKPVSTDKGWDNVAVWFVNKRFAHIGFPKTGKPSCGRATKKCRPYTYNKRTGRVKIRGMKAGKVNSATLRIGKQSYYPLTVPKAGTKLAVKLIHQNFSGFCGIYCNTWTEWLTMDKKGRFVRSRMSIGSLGAPGVGSIWAVSPADQRGRYRILKNGRIRFDYANGTKRTFSIGVEHDVRERPSPAGAGLLIGDVNFYLG